MRGLAVLLALSLAGIASAATIHNDASCDIAVAPAATLLLPYFEVDLDDPRGEVTIFTITNVTHVERIARVTLWTDYAVPVLTFNVALTGYDVQSVSLYDVLARGLTPDRQATRGAHSKRNRGLDTNDCAARTPLPEEYLGVLRSVFLQGVMPGDGLTFCNNVGTEHDNAAGYATIDVVGNCSANGPDSAAYWSEDLRYDNVLVGDYQQVHAANGYAQGSPLVHIRAVPEGGTPAERAAVAVPFPQTFYGIYQSAAAPRLDARQPLPSTFATRWIARFSKDSFATELKIWRQGDRHTTCAGHDEAGLQLHVELTRFDEAENAVTDASFCRMLCIGPFPELASTSRSHISDSNVYPTMNNGAIAGWIYLNLDNDVRDATASQNWVVASMRAEGRYSVDVDAVPLGNGCSAPAGASELKSFPGTIIGPRP